MNSLSALRTRTLSQVVEYLIVIYRRNMTSFVLLAALIQIPVAVANFVIISRVVDSMAKSGLLTVISNPQAQLTLEQMQSMFNPVIGPLLIAAILGIFAAIIQVLLVDCPIVYITSEEQLGRRVSIGEALVTLQGRFGSILYGLVIYGLVMLGLGIAALVLTLFTCGISLAVFGFVYLATWPLLVPVLTLEKIAPNTAAIRSFRLTKAQLWPILGLTVVVMVFTSFIAPQIAGLFTPATSTVNGIVRDSVLSVVVLTVFNILAAPVLPIAYALLYLDARVRVEDLDSALAAAPESHPGDIPGTLTGNLIEGGDWMNIAIGVMVIFVVSLIYVVLTGLTGGAGAAIPK